MTVEIAEMLAPRVFVEKDIMGTVHIKMQYKDNEPFDFIQIQYCYPFTSNSHQKKLTGEILKLLGVGGK
jgi:hypothetical protein